MDHLSPGAAEALKLSDRERIDFCRSDQWVGYTRAKEVLEELDGLLLYPKTLRMGCRLLVGRSANGKSSILNQFVRRNPISSDESGKAIMPILSIEMPESPTESELWSLILWRCGISHRERDSSAVKKRQAKSAMQFVRTRILLIDEFNNLVNAGKNATVILAAIKGISNELKLSIVAAGTQSAINALNSDPQMKSRFEPCVLHRWKLDREYLRFLASYERVLPLKSPSQLATRELATQIYANAGETIGLTVRILKEAAVKAIQSGEERITVGILESLNLASKRDWDAVARQV